MNQEPEGQSNDSMRLAFKSLRALSLWALLGLFLWTPGAMATDAVVEELRRTIGVLHRAPAMVLHCEQLHSGNDLLTFYEERGFEPLWVTSRGTNDLGAQLPFHFRQAKAHGLNPEDYHHSCVRSIIGSVLELERMNLPASPRLLAELDILMTDGFMVYASHLSTGRINPADLYPQWLSEQSKRGILEGLSSLLTHRDLERVLGKFAPSHREYWALMEAGQKMKAMVEGGGWPSVPPGTMLRRGESDPRTPVLRERLQISGDLKAPHGGEDNSYDEDLYAAVKRFQARHGLQVDGVVGPQTISALNMSAEARHQQILLNLERWRWLPHQWEDRYVLVNTAAFHLDAWKDQRKELSMRVIVGKDYQKTPDFSEKMTYLEFNPYWNVPRSIAVREYLPKLRENPGFAHENNFELIEGRGRNARVIDPWSVDWETVKPADFRWLLRQTPGPWNALGRVKFMFPNKFNVYLHDTPQRHLFQRHQRAFSHGCIRIEKPLELARLLLEDNPSWTRERIERVIASGNRRVVTLPKPWMVHIYYWTAWVDEEGKLQFRRDLYDRDEAVWAALKG